MPPEKERTEARLTILPPPPCSTKRRAAAWLRYQRLLRLMFITSSQSFLPTHLRLLRDSYDQVRHDDVQATQLGRALAHDPRCLLRARLHEVYVHGVAASAELLDLLAGLVEGKDVEDGDVGARLGESDGEGLAQAAPGPRHQGDTAVEGEVVEDSH